MSGLSKWHRILLLLTISTAFKYLPPYGRHEETIAELRRAVELDPVSVLHLSNLGWVYYMAHQYDPAIEYLQRSLELEPDHTDGHRGLGETYVQKGMYDEAVASMQKYVDLTEGRTDYALAYLGYAYGTGGPARPSNGDSRDTARASRTTACRARTPLRRSMSALGDNDKAIEALWRDYEERSYALSCFGSKCFRCSNDFLFRSPIYQSPAQDRRRTAMIGLGKAAGWSHRHFRQARSSTGIGLREWGLSGQAGRGNKLVGDLLTPLLHGDRRCAAKTGTRHHARSYRGGDR